MQLHHRLSDIKLFQNIKFFNPLSFLFHFHQKLIYLNQNIQINF